MLGTRTMPKDLDEIANLLQWEKGTEKCSIRLAAILMHGILQQILKIEEKIYNMRHH
jgi:hypothetical protein